MHAQLRAIATDDVDTVIAHYRDTAGPDVTVKFINDLVAGQAGFAGGGAEGGLGCFAGELDFLDPAVDDRGIGAGLEASR